MNQRVGTCSLCGGDVYGFRGAWGATVPPPPDICSKCGAIAASDVIQMVKPGVTVKINNSYYGTTTYGTTTGDTDEI